MSRDQLAPWEIYVVEEGDRGLEAIAWFVYLDGSLWPKLWLANRDILSHPDDLRPGQVLRIPQKAPLTPAERRELRAYPLGKGR